MTEKSEALSHLHLPRFDIRVTPVVSNFAFLCIQHPTVSDHLTILQFLILPRVAVRSSCYRRNSDIKPGQMEVAQTFQSWPSRRRKLRFQTLLIRVKNEDLNGCTIRRLYLFLGNNDTSLSYHNIRLENKVYVDNFTLQCKYVKKSG